MQDYIAFSRIFLVVRWVLLKSLERISKDIQFIEPTYMWIPTYFDASFDDVPLPVVLLNESVL